MLPDPILAAEARRWATWASDDLAAARAMTVGVAAVFPRQACYLAQQAAEKAVKALLIAHDIDFPKTHDLLRLRALLPPAAQAQSVAGAWSELTDWVVQARYPGPGPDACMSDAQHAIALAQAILDSVALDLVAAGVATNGKHVGPG
jgi:HEPN domain-containing protein